MLLMGGAVGAAIDGKGKNMATYECTRCAGRGRLAGFSNVLGGVCFKCNGSGEQAAKPGKPSIKWAVLGEDRNTGERARLYNVSAKTEAAAIEKARSTFAGASAAFKDQYTLSNAIAVRASEIDQQAA
jgi:hypothetical protein